jgi:hypothetical protein
MTKESKLTRGGGEYPVCKITNNDITSIASVCKGFIHGGKKAGLKAILGTNELRCSNVLRDEGLPMARDNTDMYPAGDAMYFRFISSFL